MLATYQVHNISPSRKPVQGSWQDSNLHLHPEVMLRMVLYPLSYSGSAPAWLRELFSDDRIAQSLL